MAKTKMEKRERPTNRQSLSTSLVPSGGKGQVPAGLKTQTDVGRNSPPVPFMPAIIVAGRNIPPRAHIAQISQNLDSSTRRWQGKSISTFEQLRHLSEFDMVQICQSDLRGQIRAMSWGVHVKNEFKDQEQALQDAVSGVKDWVRFPDPLGGLEFNSFVDKMLDEVLVTDALTLFPRFNRGGQPIGLEQIDGSSIKPLVDERGRPPLPDNLAYVQWVNGIPETGFTTQQLWYMPMNRRSDSPYGFSCVERVILTINLAFRAQFADLSWFVHGNLPDALYEVPESWTPEMIEDYQEIFDSLLQGRDDRKMGSVRFIPGGGKYTETKTRTFQYEFQEYLARVICWSFGVSPIPIAKMVNRATAEQLEESTLESGVRPVSEFIATVFNRYIWHVLGYPEIEFVWGGDEVEDAAMVVSRNVAYVGNGTISIDDVRGQLGMEPLGIGPMIIPSGGGEPIFIDDLIARKGKAESDKTTRLDQARFQPAFLNVPVIKRDELRVSMGLDPVGGEFGDEFVTAGQDNISGVPTGGVPSVPPRQIPGVMERNVTDELRKWKRMHMKRARAGKAGRQFYSTVIPPVLLKSVHNQLRMAKSIGDVDKVFNHALQKQGDPSISGQLDGQRRFTDLLTTWLDEHMESILAFAEHQLAIKETPGEDDEIEKVASSTTLQKQDFPSLDDLVFDLRDILNDTVESGARDGAASVGFSLDVVPTEALDFATRRAAELVGKTFQDGVLVDNPNARFAISQILRDDINASVTQAIQQGWSPQRLRAHLQDSLGFARAETIARTETALAYGNGAATIYKDQGIELLEILDGKDCLPRGHKEKSPKATGTPGVVEDGREANGQVWTTEQYKENLIGHPRCVRAAVVFISKTEE